MKIVPALQSREDEHQKNAFTLISHELDGLIGFNRQFPQWHLIKGGKWKEAGSLLILFLVSGFFFLLTLSVFLVSPSWETAAWPIVWITIPLLVYLLTIRRDHFVTGYVRTFDVSVSTLWKDLEPALRREGFQPSRHQVDLLFPESRESIALMIEGVVTLLLVEHMKGCAIHIGPYTGKTKDRVMEVKRLIDEIAIGM